VKQEWEIYHWNKHVPSLKDHRCKLRSLPLGKDCNGAQYWMLGSATGQLLGKMKNGHWGLFEIPYRVYTLWVC